MWLEHNECVPHIENMSIYQIVRNDDGHHVITRVTERIPRNSPVVRIANPHEVTPGEIEDECEIIAYDIKNRMPFDLSRKKINVLSIKSSTIDLSDPHLPRKIEQLSITYSYLIGNFHSPMEVTSLGLHHLRYVQNLPAFKEFFKNVQRLTCNVPLGLISAYIPLSATMVDRSRWFSVEEATAILASHPNCRAISMRVHDIETAKRFLLKHIDRLFLDWQMTDTMLHVPHSTWVTELRETLEEAKRQKQREMVSAHRILSERKFNVPRMDRETQQLHIVQRHIDPGPIARNIASYLRPSEANKQIPKKVRHSHQD